MRFQRGIPHPPRGPGRKPYRMTEAALRARRRNFAEARSREKIKLWRGRDESLLIKLLIWQACFGPEPRPSQRALARKFRVWPSYVCKVQKKAGTVGMDALIHEGKRVTLHDLERARRVTSRVRERVPDLFAPTPQPGASGEPRVMTDDEMIAENWRIARDEQRKNPSYSMWRRVLFSVPVR